jgi:hypothetical protein
VDHEPLVREGDGVAHVEEEREAAIEREAARLQ